MLALASMVKQAFGQQLVSRIFPRVMQWHLSDGQADVNAVRPGHEVSSHEELQVKPYLCRGPPCPYAGALLYLRYHLSQQHAGEQLNNLSGTAWDAGNSLDCSSLGGGNSLRPFSQQRHMRTNLSWCPGFIDNGQQKSTNRLLLLVPNKRAHGIMRILENLCMLLPKALKMRAIKDTMALVTDSIGGTKCASAQMSRLTQDVFNVRTSLKVLSNLPKVTRAPGSTLGLGSPLNRAGMPRQGAEEFPGQEAAWFCACSGGLRPQPVIRLCP